MRSTCRKLTASLKADIIYHLFDAFTAYNQEIVEAKRKDAAPQAVWPCRLKIIAAFCKRDPIILGVDILDGTLRIGTPIAVVKTDPTTQKKEIIDLGKMFVLPCSCFFAAMLITCIAVHHWKSTTRLRTCAVSLFFYVAPY